MIATGFMPMLTYGRLAGFKPTTLEERWLREPRAIVELALDLAGVEPVVKVSEPVVDASLLTGPAGSAIVLANYTYRPVADLALEVRLAHSVAAVASAEGREVAWSGIPGGIPIVARRATHRRDEQAAKRREGGPGGERVSDGDR